MRPILAALVLLAMFATPTAWATTTSAATLADSAGAAGDEFGRAVATSGDRVVVGAPLKDGAAGAVFIYERLAQGGWTGIRVTADDRHAGDQFGYAVDIDGDTVVIGALFGDGASADTGTAYVLEPADNGFWTQTAIPAPDGKANDNYGVSVAVSGDRVVVGAEGDDDLGSESGAVYVWDHSGASWASTKLISGDGATNDLFGRSVAVDNNTVVVGSIYDDGTATDQGSISVFTNAGTSWTETKLTSSEPVRWGLFGNAVAVAGERVVVGAPLHGNGAVFVYEHGDSGWHEAKLSASDGTSEDQFGASVAVSVDRIVVGAPNDGGVAQNSGALYSYTLSDAHWFETKFVDEAGSGGDSYGASVDVDGEVAVAGSPLNDATASNAGRVFAIEPGDEPTAPPPVSFGDIANTTFESEILWMVEAGITDGCGDGNFCPNEAVTRAQMAVFLMRALDLPPGDPARFADVGGAHAEAASAIATAGISLGCGDGTVFCPYDPVTRAQMGSFFARALGLELSSENRFEDVSGTHTAAINAIAREQVTLGCSQDGLLYCPNRDITRGQMSAFIYRALSG